MRKIIAIVFCNDCNPQYEVKYKNQGIAGLISKNKMNVVNKNFFILLIVTAILLWFIANVVGILTPFIAALIISYFLAPFVNLLERYKIPRNFGTIIAILILGLFLTVLSLTIFPVLYKEVSALVNLAVGQKHQVQDAISKLAENLNSISPAIKEKVQDAVLNFSSEVMNFFGTILGKLIHSGFAAVNIISLTFITPIVLFYVLKDWNNMIKALEKLVPAKYAKATYQLFGDINKCMAGYIRGQSLVCLSLGIYYTTALFIVKVESNLALGFICGLLSFIPFIGFLFSCFLCLLVALMQFGEIYHVSLVLIVFLIGQLLESYILVPRLVGSKVNLHPVWIMFGLMAGGALFGFVGVLFALPLTAILGVIIRFALHYYHKSIFYTRTK